MVLGRFMGAVLVIGAGALAIGAVIAAPKIFAAARPLVREGLRRGMTAYEHARASAVQLAEDVDDMVAEVRAEIAEKASVKDAPPSERQSA